MVGRAVEEVEGGGGEFTLKDLTIDKIRVTHGHIQGGQTFRKE